MDSKLRVFLLLALASTFTATGSVLFGFTLALDSWRTKNIFSKSDNYSLLHVSQGILHECVSNKTRANVCRSWDFVEDLIEFQELLLSLIISAAVSGALSLIVSLGATTSRIPKFVITVTALEFVSSLLGSTATVLYTLIYNKDPWSLGPSYFILLMATTLLISGLIIHFLMGEVRLFGKRFFVKPSPTYRYTKGATEDVLEEI